MIDPLILMRWVHFAASAIAAGTVLFVVAIGELAFRAAGANAELAVFRGAARWIAWTALAISVASGGCWLVWLASDIYGASLLNVCLHGGAWSVLHETRFGLVCVIRLILALSLGVLILWPATRLLQLVAAAGFLALPAFIGHAGATPGGAGRLHLAADILHLLAAGAWIGALPALALLLHRAKRTGPGAWSAAAASAARRFSPLGIVAVGTLLVTGVINSWYLLAGPRDLVVTAYGRIVLLKIALLAILVGIAAVNRFALTPRLALPAAMRSLERNVLVEIGLGLCVFLLVGALGTMSPPAHGHIHIPTEKIAADAAFVHIHSSEAMADVTIEPGRPGPARRRILLMREDFSIFTAKDVTLVLTPQTAAGASPISQAALRLPDGAWRVNGLHIAKPGIWTVKLVINGGSARPIVLDAPVVIEP